MAQPSKLGRRLARIERSNGNDRCLPRWPARLAIVAMAIIMGTVIGAIQLVRTEARATKLDDHPTTSKADAPALPAGNVDRVFHLQVVAAGTGEPVPEADVRVWMNFQDDWRQTDAQGRLDITHSDGRSYGNFGIDVWGKGRAMQRHTWGHDPNQPIPEGATIQLQPGETLGGLVQDEEGRPIAGATVLLWSHNYQRKDPHEMFYDLRAVTGPDGRWQTSGAPETTGELLGFQIIHPDFLSSRDYDNKEIIPKIADLRAGKAVTVMKKGVPIEGRVVDADGKPVAGARVLSTDNQQAMFTDIDQFAVSTDAGGRFRTPQVKPGRMVPRGQRQGTRPGRPAREVGTAVPQVEITLGRARPFKGRVVDPDGKPIAGAFVNPDTWRRLPLPGGIPLDRRRRPVPLGRRAQRRVDRQRQPTRLPRASPSSTWPHRARMWSSRSTPPSGFKATVRDAETKKRVENATVEYSAVDPETGEPSKWTGMPELGYEHRGLPGQS